MMKTKLFKKRVPMLFSAMLTLIALLTATLQAAVMPPLLQPSNNQTLWGSYFYGDYTKGEPVRLTGTYSLVNSAPSNWSGNYIFVGTASNGDYRAPSSGTVSSEAIATAIVTPSNNTLTNPSGIYVINISDAGSGKYFLKLDNSNYIIASKFGSWYDLGSQTTEPTDDYGKWTISMSSGNQVEFINSGATSYRFLFYASTQDKFYLTDATPSTTYVLPYLYRESSSHDVSASSGISNGSLSFSTDNSTYTSSLSGVSSGTTVYVRATPSDDCYELTALSYNDGTDHTISTTSTPYTFTMPASDVTVNATFAVKSFNVNLSACSNGDLYITGGNVTNHLVSDALYVCEVACNSSVTLEIKNITAGSEFLGWRVNGAIVSTANPWTFTATETVSPTPVFGQKYTVTCAATTNGSISADKATAAETETVTITATPATGYELETLTYTPDGGSAVTISGTTFSMPAANVTVNATFTKACGHYYYLVEEDLDDWTGEYLIVYTTGNKAFNGGLTTLDAANNNISVSISDKMITKDAFTSAAHFDIAKTGDYYTIKSASGYYIGVRNANGALNQSPSVTVDYRHTITSDGNNVWLKSYEGNGNYLEFNKTSGQNRFRYYSVQTSQQPIQLYRKGVMKPVITPADGSVFISAMQPVTITAPDGVSKIYYTTDGTEPTTSSNEYTSYFTINTTTTVKAIAVNECGEASFVATALIRSADDDIVMTPLSGTYLAGTEVTIMSPGAFHYTTDGTEPSTTNGTAVSGNSATISVDSTMTIWAVLDSDATKNAKEYYVVPSGTYTGENPDGIVMNKSVSGNFSNSGAADYGTGNITLESYVTGNVSVVEGEVEPVDVVLVLDYSGSMKTYNIDESDPTSITRLAALKNAALLFLQQLEASNNTTDPHRVAFILYGDDVRLYYNNNGSLGYAQGTTYNYETAVYTPEICSKAFFSYGDAVEALKPNSVWNSIKDINTLGGTQIGKAINVADYVLAQNTSSSHKKFVITLTDGAPGTEAWSADDNCDVTSNMTGASARMANYCLEKMHAGTTGIETKYDAKSYTIGIFSGANDSYTTLPTYYPNTLVDGTTHNNEYLASNINRFMNLLSSNSVATNLCDANNTWNNNHYYLSATDAEELNEIFKGIASAIGGASADLSSQTIVQDVMSSQFAIPAGTTASSITVQTAECTGVSGSDTTWATPVNLPNPNIQFSEDGKTIMVTGFDYASNWVGYNEDAGEWHGAKLIVTIPISFDPSLTDDDVFHGTFATNAAGSGIYDADGMPVGNFTSPTTNVDHGKVTWVQKVTAQPSTWTVTNDTVMIGTENDLAWFISYVNGMNGATAQPAAKAKLTADLDMSANLWVPIGYNNNHKFTGTFDGNGYTIKGINIPTESAAEYISWRFNTGTGIDGSTEGETTTGTVTSYKMNTDLVNEGFFGYTYGATINNLFLTGGKFVTDTIANVNLGGIVGYSTNNTSVNFAESAIDLVVSDSTTNGYVGGITGYSTNGCNFNGVMAVGDITINGKASGAGSISGRQGTIKTFYTNHTISGEGTVTTKNTTGTNGYSIIANTGYTMGTTGFTAPTAYTYGSYSTNNTVNGTPLVDLLNDDSNLASGYKWMRSTSQAINGDYPIIVKAENDGFAIVNDSVDGKVVRYQEINTLLGMEKYQSANHSVFMYNNDELTTAPSGTKLYIDQNVAMTQSAACGAVNAYVSVTIDNSNGAAEMHRDWHGFAASIAAGKIGISYGNHQVTNPGYSENDLTFGNGANDDYYLIQGDNAVYFPDGIVNATNPGKQFDIYSFFEDQYHWINLKRAPSNHWHQDGEHAQISYTNEKSFTPGKGYFVALGDNTDNDNNLMQAYGTLNNGATAITVPITNSGDHLKGYNLLGNPFQSYLDFNAFAETNKNIWAGTSSMGYKSYMIYDADKGGFREYLTDGSQSFSQNAAQDAPRYINMHQAFFVVKDGSASNVTFNNDMRVTDATVADGTSFRDARPAYPLVNLFCTDEDGKQEISVVELNRPEMAGSLKMKGMLNGKCNMYLHWNNEDFGSMFIDHTPDYVPVWFDAAEDGVFTISWNTQNAAFGYVHFVDNMTGADIDCLEADSYTFEARTTDMSARFRLVFSPLGVEDITTENGENFAFFNGSELVVNGEGELSLIDLNGRVLTTTFVSGQQSNVMLPTVAEGMYLLRLTKANDVKVQKIVIRK